MGLSAPLKKLILPEDPIAPKSDRMEFLTYLQIEALAINGKRNKFKGSSVTVAILAGDECARQMRKLQLSKNESDRKRFAKLMSDEYDSLPLRITVPTFVFWMNRELGKRGRNLPSDHDEIKSKCKSFYDSGKKGYQGFFSKMQTAKVLTNKEQIGASGALQEHGRKAVLLWLSKDYMLGTKFEMKSKKAPQNVENAPILEGKTENLAAIQPPFLAPKVGNSYQSINNIISNEIINTDINKDTKQYGEKKSSHCGNVDNSVDDDFFPVENMATPEKNLTVTGKTAHLKASAERPEHAIPRGGGEIFDDAERIQNAKFLAENAKNVAEKLKELYEIALEKGQVRGSMQKVFTKENFEKWNWAKIENSASDILQALRKEGELWGIVGERVLKTIEKEVKRLKNPEKYIMLPAMYLSTAKHKSGDWVMIRGSLVAWHDHLLADKQLEPTYTIDFNDYYKNALGNACKILAELGFRQSWITNIEEEKSPVLIVKTIQECLVREELGEIRGSLKAYIMRAVNNCGWNYRKIFAIINQVKGDNPDLERFLKWSDKNSRIHLLQNVARYANRINRNPKTRIMQEDAATGWFNWIKDEGDGGIIEIKSDYAIIQMVKEAIKGLK